MSLLRTLSFLLALCLLIGCAPEPLPDTDAALASLVEAERAFARTSVEEGMRHAFLEFLADEAVIFRPTPTNGKQWFAPRPETSGTLAWQPVFADVADTGDLGYTTGPYSFSDSAGTPVAHGHYVTVWRLQPDSTWRVEIDAGINHPKPQTPAPDRVTSPHDTTTSKALRKLYQEAARVNLLKTDRDLAVASAAQGSVEAFSAVLADSVRIYRNGGFPQIGKAVLEARLARAAGVLSWVPINAEVSQAGDLGYTYGLATFRASAEDTTAASSSYLRIWKRPPDGLWRLVLDLAYPVPSE